MIAVQVKCEIWKRKQTKTHLIQFQLFIIYKPSCLKKPGGTVEFCSKRRTRRCQQENQSRLLFRVHCGLHIPELDPSLSLTLGLSTAVYYCTSFIHCRLLAARWYEHRRPVFHLQVAKFLCVADIICIAKITCIQTLPLISLVIVHLKSVSTRIAGHERSGYCSL